VRWDRPAFAGVGFPARTIKVGRKRRALLRLRCPTGTDGFCHGRISLRRGSARIGSARYKIASGKTATVPVKLSNAAVTALRRHGKLKAVAIAVSHDAAGTSKRTAARVTLV